MAGRSTGFDKSKDRELFVTERELGKGKLVVGVYSYDGKEPKLQISRLALKEEGGWAFSPKLGRCTKEEVKALSQMFAEAFKKM